MTMDIMTALSEITGIDAPEATDGISLPAALKGEEQIAGDLYIK